LVLDFLNGPPLRKAIMRSRLRQFIGKGEGSVSILFGLALPLLALSVAGALDFVRLGNKKVELQAAADEAALAAAKELRLGNANPATISGVAQTYALAALTGRSTTAQVQASVLGTNTAVKVQIDGSFAPLLGAMSPIRKTGIHVEAVAQVMGSAAACLLALDPASVATLSLDSATLTAPGCATYSDSKSAKGIVTSGNAKIKALLICSSGGTSGSQASFSPNPTTDCPPLKDPLFSRPPPTVGACTSTNLAISRGTQTLSPGVYCGGLSISGGAHVTLGPGVFVIKDGPLSVSGGASLTGNNAGVYLTGARSVINFDFQSTIDLKAPLSGPLAGILFFEDRSAPIGRSHLMQSRSASQLLGTFYLPRGNLIVGALPPSAGAPVNCSSFQGTCPPPPANMADKSAWTVVIAQQVTVNFGINLVLNSNYGSTNVAPPAEIMTGSRLSN
jgi:hypothetical protein